MPLVLLPARLAAGPPLEVDPIRQRLCRRLVETERRYQITTMIAVVFFVWLFIAVLFLTLRWCFKVPPISVIDLGFDHPELQRTEVQDMGMDTD